MSVASIGRLRRDSSRLWRWALPLLVATGVGYAGHAQQLDQRLYVSLQTAAGEHGLGLGSYRARVQARPVEGIGKDLSGLAYDPGRGHLWAVVNNPPELVALTKAGGVLARYPLAGFDDVEGVAYLDEGLLAVVEERRDALVLIRVPGEPGSIAREGLPALTLDVAGGDNRGVEGVAYDRRGDRLFVVKEHSPRALFELRGLRASFEDGPALQVFDRSDWLGDEIFARDLSSVEYDPRSGHLLLLSDESRAVFELDAGGRLVSSRSLLRGFAGLWRSVPQPEGVALDDEGALYLVSEPNLFYVFGPD